MSSPLDLARAATSYGLPGAAASSSLPARPLDDTTWGLTLRRVVASRCTGHLAASISDGAFAATDEQASQVLDAHETALGVDLVLERLLVVTLTSLAASDVRARALKGAALAHAAYPDPALRSYGDVDILVDAAGYDAAVEHLHDLGGVRRYAEPRPGFEHRFGKGVCMVMADGYEVDLHRTFVAGPFGLSLRTEDLFDTETAIEIAGRTVVALGPEERFVHACFHAALGDREPRLVSLRDVAQILLGSPVDTSRTLDLAARWRVGAVLKRAIELTWSAFGLDSNPPLREWAREYVPSRFERQALRVYVGPSRSYAAQAVAGLRAVPDVAAKAAYARAMLVPDHGYLDERDGGYLRRLRRGVGLLVREVRQQ